MWTRGGRGALMAVAAVAAVSGCGEDRQGDGWDEEVPVADPAEVEEREPFLEFVDHPQLGVYVQTWRDEPVYLFLPDSAGESTCYDACAVAWPPLVAEREPTIDEPLDEDLVGTVPRRDGTAQVTYRGWPLYHYRGDSVPGRPQGHDVDDFDGRWLLVSPTGEPLR